jgi:glutamyl-tRNA reductase
VEATLVIIGLNFRTAPVAVRERFWMNEARRADALQQLVRSEGIDEIIILGTCNRTEFIFWASDPAEAANSVLRFLTREFNLKLSEWSNFYRLMDDNALLHLFRVATGMDSMVLGESESVGHVKRAVALAQRTGTMGRILDTVLQKTLSVAERARAESGITHSSVSLASAAAKLTRSVLGNMDSRKVVLIGAGKMSEMAACNFMNQGAARLTILDRTPEHGQELARQLGGRAMPFDARLDELKDADVLISSTSSTDTIFSREDIDSLLPARAKKPLVIIDLAVPRDIAPSVRQLPDVFLYDIDDLERALQQDAPDRHAEFVKAEAILQEELSGFRRKLMAEHIVPTIVALRSHLEELCGQELRSLEDQYGPFTEDQQSTLHSLASHITQRIAGSMARELKGLPEKADQQLLTEAVQRLFHLHPAKAPAPALKN